MKTFSNLKVGQAKNAVDKIIRKGRVHLYKPIQIAEILHRSLVDGDVDISDLDNYRVRSREWRDNVSLRLVGNKSTSSARYQDDVFNDNAVPLSALHVLDEENKTSNGIVENYIYQKLCGTWDALVDLYSYVSNKDPKDFSFRDFVSKFEQTSGLKQSIDKAYEIAVYALFQTLTRALNVRVVLSVGEPDKDILTDFSDFIEKVVGIPKGCKKTSFSAELYRLGVANAADTGIDVLTNFGPAVQVKHVTLKPDLVEESARPLRASKVVLVCLEPEKASISAVLSQVGYRDQIQGIVTDKDLERWYNLALQKHQGKMAKQLLKDFRSEFQNEFPQVTESAKFMEERGYCEENLKGIWQLDKPLL